MSSSRLDDLLGHLDLHTAHRLLDVGCGTGELAIRAAEQTGCRVLGVDTSAEKIAEAERAASIRLRDPSRVEFRTQDAKALDPLLHFDRAVCMGSTHAFASGEAAYERTLTNLRGVVESGGSILVGEGYWKKEPAAEYLALLGDTPGIYRTHAENVFFAESLGWAPLYAGTSTDDEWDAFEWGHRRRYEDEARNQPDEPAVQERLRASRHWRDGYLRWGRDTMGFGFYVLRRTS